MILCFSRIDSRYLRAKTSKLINPSPFLLKGSCCLPALLLLLCSLECNLTSAPHPRKLLTLLSFTLQTESRRCGDTFPWGPNSVNLESRCSGLRATPYQSWAKSSWVTRGAHMFFRVCVCVCVYVCTTFELQQAAAWCVNVVVQHCLGHCLWQLWSCRSRVVLTETGPCALPDGNICYLVL